MEIYKSFLIMKLLINWYWFSKRSRQLIISPCPAGTKRDLVFATSIEPDQLHFHAVWPGSILLSSHFNSQLLIPRIDNGVLKWKGDKPIKDIQHLLPRCQQSFCISKYYPFQNVWQNCASIINCNWLLQN